MIVPKYVFVLFDGKTLEPYSAFDDYDTAHTLAVNGLCVATYTVNFEETEECKVIDNGNI